MTTEVHFQLGLSPKSGVLLKLLIQHVEMFALTKSQDRLLWWVITWTARVFGHFTIAVVGWLLDWVAFKIGRLWAALLLSVIVRNGRFVPIVALACDWLLNPKDATFVISMTMLLVFVASPLCFPDLDVPNTELWHSYSKTGTITTPLFVLYSIFLHYPNKTISVVKGKASDLWHQPPTLMEAMDWSWTALTILAIPTVLYGLVASRFVRDSFDSLCRLAGKRVRELRFPDDPKNSPTSDPYQHKAIQSETGEIRLLQILPRVTNGEVSCRIIPVSLLKPPPYEAMSYTWGDPAQTKTIFIDGKPFKTTQNVFDLLYDRSPILSPRTIWIDAICINQNNNEEKAQQVRIMSAIYSRASQVAVWLGSGRNSDLAVSLILELSDYIETEKPSDSELYEKYVKERRSPRWLAVGDMLCHSYFSRIWMVQEVASNRTLHVIYGREVIRWQTLARVIPRLLLSFDFSVMVEDTGMGSERRSPALATSMNALILQNVRDSFQTPEKATSKRTLTELLQVCWTFQATDPRDKIFALTGLVPEEDHPLVRPDYTKSVEQVYMNAALYLFSQENCISQLLYCSGIGWPRNYESLPSWAPDWSIVGRCVIGNLPTWSESYRTSFRLPVQTPYITHGHMLGLNAILVDEAEHLGNEFERIKSDPDTGWTENSGDTHEKTVFWLCEAQALAQHAGPVNYDKTGQSIEEALWRTLICDAPSSGVEAAQNMWPASQTFGQYYRYAIQYLVLDQKIEDDTGLTREDIYIRMRLASRWLTSAQSKCYSRRFCITKNGYMCVLPARSKKGDVVAVIPGAVVPFLLRPSGQDEDTGNNIYQLVGECYVHGLMSGEAADPRAMVPILLR